MSMDDSHSRTVSRDCDGMASILNTSFVKSCIRGSSALVPVLTKVSSWGLTRENLINLTQL